MCVIYFAYQVHSHFPLILLANRDEYYDRPTLSASYWPDFPQVYAGRDLVGGGTWLGVSMAGRFAALTNFRESAERKKTLSRGMLVADFLTSNESSVEYLRRIQRVSAKFSGFNLFVGEVRDNTFNLYYYSNRGRSIEKVESGIFGISNHLLDTPWPKVIKGKRRLAEILSHNFSIEESFKLLEDKCVAPEDSLPETGIGYEREKRLSAIFIETPDYGTRSSAVVTLDREMRFNLIERVYSPSTESATSLAQSSNLLTLAPNRI
jgi:uncharacterized protein with NRDE domain